MALDKDGRPVNTGFPPTPPQGYRSIIDWLNELGALDDFPDAVFLQIGIDKGGVRMADLATDVETQAIFGAARDALVFIAGRLTGYQFFVEGQRRGLAVGVIYAPEDRLRGSPLRGDLLSHAGSRHGEAAGGARRLRARCSSARRGGSPVRRRSWASTTTSSTGSVSS